MTGTSGISGNHRTLWQRREITAASRSCPSFSTYPLLNNLTRRCCRFALRTPTQDRFFMSATVLPGCCQEVQAIELRVPLSETARRGFLQKEATPSRRIQEHLPNGRSPLWQEHLATLRRALRCVTRVQLTGVMGVSKTRVAQYRKLESTTLTLSNP